MQGNIPNIQPSSSKRTKTSHQTHLSIDNMKVGPENGDSSLLLSDLTMISHTQNIKTTMENTPEILTPRSENIHTPIYSTTTIGNTLKILHPIKELVQTTNIFPPSNRPKLKLHRDSEQIDEQLKDQMAIKSNTIIKST
ncbi:hypothetical protein F8M41_024047 [Gigaspora margarita]|uniref:Uncharacterized protein n=1 Tax=Gigaspora margarita TaxID=4874 RepID=A0A8H4ACD9_GIGMA|nr:hypothetical protein F8M41_024047 [Gigaspora margarita]